MMSGISDMATLGYLLVAVVFSAFLLRGVRALHRGAAADMASRLFLLALASTAAWGWAMVAVQYWDGYWLAVAGDLLDAVRYGLWLSFLTMLIRQGARPGEVGRRWRVTGFVVAMVVIARLLSALAPPSGALGGPGAVARIASSLGLAVLGLVLVEQVFRNLGEDSKWSAKPLCIGLACVFGFDLFVFSEAQLFGRFDSDAMSVRGLVHALSAPLLLVAARRNAYWTSKVQLSRTAAFYSASLVLIGLYLLAVAAAGYYVREFGGHWGRALQLAVVVGAIVVLALLALSGTLRAQLRVFLGKNLFRYRYDYRREWLRFTTTLSSANSPQAVGVLVIRGLADLLESTGGSLWSIDRDGLEYRQLDVWNMPRVSTSEPAASPFSRFLRDTGWIIDLDGYRSAPRRYPGLALPAWLLAQANAWWVIPLLVGDQLVGFVVLAQARANVELNWEVTDLLKTASRQAASFMAQQQATEALLEARKFEAFNRMSAFVVHDLKNIVTQLSLMMKNAQRHRENPEFQQDMLLTVESSLDKMRQLMVQLREGERPAGGTSGVDLVALLRRLDSDVAARGRRIEVHIADRIATRGHEQRLERVVGHVVQNALDATPPSGRVWVRLEQSAGRAMLVVGDTGAGMSQEFVNQRLFRPFNTTKPSGMGIGSFESAQYLKELGGSISVDSEPGKGTIVTMFMPLFDSGAADSDLQALHSV
jgi:putative PEP-CTERM system histidine kinase